MTKDDPTTLYIYPASEDIVAVSHAVASGRPPSSAGAYWNAACLKQIGAPRFWPKSQLEPLLARYQQQHPPPPPRPLPLCPNQ